MITEYAGEVNNFRRSNWSKYNWCRRGIRYKHIKEGLKPTKIALPTSKAGLYMKVLDKRRDNITSYRLADVKGVRWI